MANIKAGSTYYNDNNDQLLVDVVKAGTATYLLTQDCIKGFPRRMTVAVGTLASLISEHGFVLYGVDES